MFPTQVLLDSLFIVQLLLLFIHVCKKYIFLYIGTATESFLLGSHTPVKNENNLPGSSHKSSITVTSLHDLNQSAHLVPGSIQAFENLDRSAVFQLAASCR